VPSALGKSQVATQVGVDEIGDGELEFEAVGIEARRHDGSV
jgi:hypothetical protein